MENINYNNLLSRAIHLAVNAHADTINKDGWPYILHPLRLMNKADTVEEKIVSVLHDTIEDAWVTLEYLEQQMYPKFIINAIDAVSRRDEETYEDFIERIALNPLAIKVKLLDLYDNIDVTRLPELGDWELKRVAKYHKAILRLKEAERDHKV